MKITIRDFKGISPKTDPISLPDNGAQTAHDCSVESGVLKLYDGVESLSSFTQPTIVPDTFPIFNAPTVAESSILTTDMLEGITITYKEDYYTGTAKTITSSTADIISTDIGFKITLPTISNEKVSISYAGIDKQLYYKSDNTWSNPWWRSLKVRLVNPVTGVEGDELTAYCNDGTTINFVPTKYYNSIRSQGLSMQYNRPSYSSAETVASSNRTFVRYRIAGMDANGRIGPPSEPSAGIAMTDTTSILVTIPSILTAGNVDITKYVIYRSTYSVQLRDYKIVDTVDVGDSTYDDLINLVSHLGNPIRTYNSNILYGNAPSGLTGIIKMPTGFYVGYVGKQLYFSGINEYNHEWSAFYSMPIDYNIIKLYPLNNACVIMTEEASYAVFGSNVYEHFAILINRNGLTSSESSTFYLDKAYYTSYDGLMEIGSRVFNVITKNTFNIHQWRALLPATATLTRYENGLFMKTANALTNNYIFDLTNGTVTTTLSTTTNYDATTYNWKSKKFLTPKPKAFQTARILSSSSGTISFKLYGDENLLYSATVSVNESFQMPIIKKCIYWEVEVDSSIPIIEILIADSPDEIGQQ